MTRAGLAGLLAVPALGFAGLLLVTTLDTGPPTAAGGCGNPGTAVTVTAQLPAGVGQWNRDQLSIAATIMRAGADHHLDARAQTIGVMVGMGETSLANLLHGDAAGPDSLGVFQQRASWGTVAERTTPYIAAGKFFDVLSLVAGWETMPPTLAAHAVQRNADPNYYAQFWDQAVAVVTALAAPGATVAEVAAGTGALPCTATTPTAGVPGNGWVRPGVGTLSSGFGWRAATSVSPAELHAGQDIAAPCGTPILAAHAGVITKAGPSSGFGDAIFEDVGGGVSVWYGHEFPSGLLVQVGDRVSAGQEIGLVGSNGQSTGCHDHFQINVNGTPVDPVPFMATHGAPLGVT